MTIAEMMLDGTLCEDCGVYVPGASEGIPRRCRDCRGCVPKKPAAHVPKALCAVCGRTVKRAGIGDHMKALHSTIGTAAERAK